MSRVTRSAGAARNRRRLPWVVLGVFAVCVFGMWLITSALGRPFVDALIAGAIFWLIAFPLVWFLVKE